jgi:putative flippase GtrA
MKKIFQHPNVQRHLSQLVKFALCGGIGATIDLSTLTFFVEVLGVNPHLGFAISTLLAVIFVFLANKHFTFKNHEKKYVSQACKFAIVYGIAIALNISLSSFLYWVGLHYLLSKVVAIGTIAIWNYALSHGFVFKKKENIDSAVF